MLHFDEKCNTSYPNKNDSDYINVPQITNNENITHFNTKLDVPVNGNPLTVCVSNHNQYKNECFVLLSTAIVYTFEHSSTIGQRLTVIIYD